MPVFLFFAGKRGRLFHLLFPKALDSQQNHQHTPQHTDDMLVL